MGGRSSVGVADARCQYTGKERDIETGYDYFGARYYDSRVARWLAVDPSADRLAEWTPYNYALNNPLSNYDPDGALSLPANSGAVRRPGETFRQTVQSIGINLQESARIFSKGDIGGSLLSFTAAYVQTLLLPSTLLSDAPGIEVLGVGVSVIEVGAVTASKVASQATQVADDAGKDIHFSDPQGVAAGKDFTRAQKTALLEANASANSGIIRSDQSGKALVKPQQHVKGVTPPSNEAQIDHIKPKSKGGTNSYKNAQVLSREENLKKSNK